MNYIIIQDQPQLERFIELLPDLEENETFYCCLFARKKYHPDVTSAKSDKAQLKRFTSTKERLVSKIRQLEAPLGSYTQMRKEGGEMPVPQEALAFYIALNPRDLEAACINTTKVLIDRAFDPHRTFNPQVIAMSEIQKARSRKIWIDFDFDDMEWTDIMFRIDALEIINLDCISILKTRGGFHLLIKIDKIAEQYKNNWYKNIMKLGPDVARDIMMPCPGTYQGGFTPRLVMINGEETIDNY